MRSKIVRVISCRVSERKRKESKVHKACRLNWKCNEQWAFKCVYRHVMINWLSKLRVPLFGVTRSINMNHMTKNCYFIYFYTLIVLLFSVESNFWQFISLLAENRNVLRIGIDAMDFSELEKCVVVLAEFLDKNVNRWTNWPFLHHKRSVKQNKESVTQKN